MKRVYKLSTIAILLSIACNKPARKYEITRIDLATGSCLGPCQSTAIAIDSSLNYHYFGYHLISPHKGKLEGAYQGIITKAMWDTLNNRLDEIHYKQLDSSYEQTVDDQSLELVVHYQNKVKHIKAQSASLPRDAHEFFYWIANSYKYVNLHAVKDTFKFETMIQRPVPMPSLPPGVKFLPPKD